MIHGAIFVNCYFKIKKSDKKNKKNGFQINPAGQKILLAGHFWPAGRLLPTPAIGFHISNSNPTLTKLIRHYHCFLSKRKML